MDLGALGATALSPEEFAVAGAVPRFAARPADRDALCELLRAATRDGLGVVAWGGGTALRFEAPPANYDLAIDLGALDRLIEYEPEDLTLTAECGITIAALRERLAARGQELPLEAAHSGRATLGGVLAANTSGPRRLRLGAPRDRILGARFVLGDGTLARTGGKVVKNVAGYGIHRLLCGARGALAIVVDASLKLLPAPAARVALVYELDAAVLADAKHWAPFPRFEPAVLTVVDGVTASGSRPGGAPLPGATSARAQWVAVGFEDDLPRVAELSAATVRVLGTPALELRDGVAANLWQQLADLAARPGPCLTFASAHNTPAAVLVPGLSSSAGAAQAAALPDSSAAVTAADGGFIFHAPCGKLHCWVTAESAPSMVERMAAAGFALVDARGVEVEAAVPPVAATRALRSRIRAALDPGSRFALGPSWERRVG